MSTPQHEPTATGGRGAAPGGPVTGAPGRAAAGPGGAGERPAPRRRSPLGAARLVLLGAAAVVLVVFAFLNLDAVPVRYLVGQSEVALIVVIAISALLGAILGAAAVWRAKS